MNEKRTSSQRSSVWVRPRRDAARLVCLLAVALAAVACERPENASEPAAERAPDPERAARDDAPETEPEPAPAEPASVASEPESAPGDVANDPAFHAALGEAAAAHRRWGLVDDHTRWAPFDCRLPPPARPARSAAPEASAHGQKLYHLYASDAPAYRNLGRDGAPPIEPGFAIVKAAWHPVALGPDDVATAQPYDPGPGDPLPDDPAIIPNYGDVAEFVVDGETTWGLGAPAGLFLMLRVAEDTPGSDAGWIYGTIDGDGTVTSSGKVTSCMACHVDASHGRLFGVEMGW